MNATMMKAVALLAFGAVWTLPVAAQTASANVNATADVQVALSAAGNQDLAFGNVFQGTNPAVTPADANSGEFQISGALNAEINVTFPSLPANLLDQATSTVNLPISFGASDAAWNTTNNRGTASTFDPSVGTTQRLDASTGLMFVYVGGTLTVTTQAAGIYDAQITVNAAYTGN